MRWRVSKENCRKRKWAELQVFLKAQIKLVRGAPDRYLIVTSRDVHRFVQFASSEGGGIIGEAVGNTFLSAGNQLSPAACRELSQTGLGAPSHVGKGQGQLLAELASLCTV